eukprot:TRINITY_DN433_c0_g1_i4.p1 TRINITY_DN433_c0_g1~~TRINITY_DN433_c0_g1_i4.p1  ORF type:complete len:2064 (-),score=356.33 TRINITY_DN433_c0_g1_i4:244-6435(-)
MNIFMRRMVVPFQIRQGEYRVVYVNDYAHEEHKRYASNTTTTAKYTAATFIPKNLYEQFRRIANIYFLIISILQLSTDLSPTNKYATIGPLTCVLFVNMMKEAFEDWSRHKSDEEVNHRTCVSVRNSKGAELLWSDVAVGDIVRVDQGEECPADMIILHSSHSAGHFYVETANLDGETNLKVLYSIQETQPLSEYAQLGNLKGYVKCEHPNSRLYSFTGTLSLQDKGDISVDVSNVMLRGTVLRNTPSVFGLVIFTGLETKIFQNSRAVPSKRSRLEILINKTLIYIFLGLGILCTYFMLAHILWVFENDSTVWYLDNLRGENGAESATSFITFLILFNNLTPISLYVSMEFVRLYQAKFIDNDLNMYYEVKDTPAKARTSNLNEELGQIQYILSDKTGTLTSNEMRFSKCSIKGKLYTFNQSNRNLVEVEPSCGQSPSSLTVTNISQVRGSQTSDMGTDELDKNEILDFIDTTAKKPTEAHDFLLALALCHTALPCNKAGRLKTAGSAVSETEFQSPSPDEVALLNAAKEAGYVLEERNQSQIVLRVHNVRRIYKILNINEFSSARKRMSVIVQTPEDSILLFCKGADSVVMELLSSGQSYSSATLAHIDRFAEEGLRTLVIAMAELSPETYHEWSKKFSAASTALMNRQQLMEDTASEIENNLTLLGATAVEDRLQEHVPETIQVLMGAGIRVWMLTGDKQETAINIAYSTRLFNYGMKIIKINTQDEGKLMSSIEGGIRKYTESFDKRKDHTFGLVIDGATLAVMMKRSDIKAKFSKLMRVCISVVACRVSPSQKAEIVSLVKSSCSPEPFTLAIGDGGNDVNMIQEAHVGVGISGKEGMQAVQSSDFSIAQFKFLKDLVLVHGKWNYHRMCKFVLYSFYKNVAFVSVLVFFTIENAFSGTTLFDSWLGAGWNVVWTFLPVIVLAITDKNCSKALVQRFPHLYLYGPLGVGFSIPKFAKWVFAGIFHAVIIYYVGTRSYSGIISKSGLSDDIFLLGTIINGALMLVVNIKILMEAHSITLVFGGSVILSIMSWFLFVFVYSFMYDISADFFHVGTEMFGRTVFWIGLPLIPAICFIYNLGVRLYGSLFRPTPIDIAREMEFVDMYYVSRNSGDHTSAALEMEPTPSSNPRVAFATEVGVESSGIIRREISAEDQANLNRALDPSSVDPSTESEQSAHLAIRSEMHIGSLEFTNDESLEKQFRDFHYSVSVNQTRLVWLMAYLLYFMNFILYFGDDSHGLIGSFSRVLAILIAGIYTLYFIATTNKKHYQETVALGFIVGVIVMQLITEKPERLLFQTIVPLVGFIIGGLRFKYACPLVLLDQIVYIIEASSTGEINVLVLNFVFLALIFGISAYGAYFSEISLRKDFTLQLMLRKEKKTTRDILENMLPSFIVNKIQDGVRVIANNEKSVSILFCEIQDFADIVTDSEPGEFVVLLDKIFDHFDNLCGKYDVQKIETVGPIYMACAGLQNAEANHALAVTRLAENMLEDCHKFARHNGLPVKIRIGINTGPVVSGVVGKKKPQYCLFGDTVNTASRMESTAPVSHIQVTAATYKYIHTSYDATEKQVFVKGKGMMTTYILQQSRKSSCSVKNKQTANSNHQVLWKHYKSLLPKFLTSQTLEADEIIGGGDLDNLTLYFRDYQVEQEYDSELRPTMLKNFRYNMMFFSILTILYIGYELYLDGAEHPAMMSLRILFLVASPFFIFIQRIPTLLPYLPVVASCNYVYLGFILSMNSIVKGEEVGVRTVIGVTQAISFFFNYGGLHFFPAFKVCLSIVLFQVFALIFSASKELDQLKDRSYFETSPGIMITYTVAYFVLNVLTKYSKDRYSRRTFLLRTSISKETKHSNELLSSMAPRAVLHQLKTGSRVVAQVYDNVAILFSDIVGFTDKSSKSEPGMIVELLSTLFSHFDVLTSIHEVYKVQTIGDAYVAVAGIPINESDEIDPDASCRNLMEFAVGMIRAITNMPTPDGNPVRIRIGLHYGRIVGGVIGRKTLRFDIWGRDVIVAATMESQGTPGKLHMSEAFMKQIENQYELDSCKQIKSSSGHNVRTYFYDPKVVPHS